MSPNLLSCISNQSKTFTACILKEPRPRALKGFLSLSISLPPIFFKSTKTQVGQKVKKDLFWMLSTLYKLWEKIIMKLLKEWQKSLYKFRLKKKKSAWLFSYGWCLTNHNVDANCVLQGQFQFLRFWRTKMVNVEGSCLESALVFPSHLWILPRSCLSCAWHISEVGSRVSCCGGTFITDFRQENHTLEEEKADSATSSIPTEGLMVLPWHRNMLTFLPTSWEND